MATLSDTLTMGIVLAVVLGSLFFYLYTRLLQVEKRISLTENILLDLKMATENTLLMMGSGGGGRFMTRDMDNEHEQTEHVEATTEAQPLQEQEVEEIKEEDFYKSVLQNAAVEPTVAPEAKQNTKMEVNYEALTKKELQEVLKQRGLTHPKGAGRKEMLDTLKKSSLPTQQVQAEEVQAGSESTLSAMDGAELVQ